MNASGRASRPRTDIADAKEESSCRPSGSCSTSGPIRLRNSRTGFREQEAPIWADLHARGLLVMATLTKLDITTVGVDGAVQYLVVAHLRDR